MRLFVALPLSDEVRARLGLLRFGVPGTRWIDPENMHVTIRFIGEVDGGMAEDIDAALSAIRAPAFEMSFAGIGFFDTGSRPHTVWAGVAKSPGLLHLREKVESAVVRAGLEPEHRKFTPHVTLARMKKTPPHRVGEILEQGGAFSAGPYAVESFTLFRSHQGGNGAYYEHLADYFLE